jgi:transposase InsO family protein
MEARQEIEAYSRWYNTARPHQALDYDVTADHYRGDREESAA